VLVLPTCAPPLQPLLRRSRFLCRLEEELTGLDTCGFSLTYVRGAPPTTLALFYERSARPWLLCPMHVQLCFSCWLAAPQRTLPQAPPPHPPRITVPPPHFPSPVFPTPAPAYVQVISTLRELFLSSRNVSLYSELLELSYLLQQ
jgi:hypothetical protein